jgi:hypothetical protein
VVLLELRHDDEVPPWGPAEDMKMLVVAIAHLSRRFRTRHIPPELSVEPNCVIAFQSPPGCPRRTAADVQTYISSVGDAAYAIVNGPVLIWGERVLQITAGKAQESPELAAGA